MKALLISSALACGPPKLTSPSGPSISQSAPVCRYIVEAFYVRTTLRESPMVAPTASSSNHLEAADVRKISGNVPQEKASVKRSTPRGDLLCKLGRRRSNSEPGANGTTADEFKPCGHQDANTYRHHVWKRRLLN